MKANFYFKHRLISEIFGPATLSAIIEKNDSENIQITDFQTIDWLWLSEYLALKQVKPVKSKVIK
jgi:hypothetical protein